MAKVEKSDVSRSLFVELLPSEKAISKGHRRVFVEQLQTLDASDFASIQNSLALDGREEGWNGYHCLSHFSGVREEAFQFVEKRPHNLLRSQSLHLSLVHDAENQLFVLPHLHLRSDELLFRPQLLLAVPVQPQESVCVRNRVFMVPAAL